MWLVKLDNFTVLVEKVLGEVPSDLSVRSLSSKVLVQWTHILPLDVRLAQNGEEKRVLAGKPAFDFLLRPGLLATKLVARVGKDLQSSLSIILVHLLVLTVMLVGEASHTRHVDHDDGLRTISQIPYRHFLLFSDAAHQNLKKGSTHSLRLKLNYINPKICA